MFFAIRKPVREAERAQPQRTASFENPSVRRPSPLRMHDRVRSAGTDRGLSKCRFSFTNKLYYITNRNTLQVKSLIFSVPAQAGGAAVSRHVRTGPHSRNVIRSGCSFSGRFSIRSRPSFTSNGIPKLSPVMRSTAAGSPANLSHPPISSVTARLLNSRPYVGSYGFFSRRLPRAFGLFQ